MPRLTLMEEVLLLGLKDKAVRLPLLLISLLTLARDTSRSGTTISRMPFVAVSLSSWRYGEGSLWFETRRVVGWHSQTA